MFQQMRNFHVEPRQFIGFYFIFSSHLLLLYRWQGVPLFGVFQYKERERVTMRAGNFSFGQSGQRKGIQFHAVKNDRIPKISFLHHPLMYAGPTPRNHIFHVVPGLIMSAIVPVRAKRSLSLDRPEKDLRSGPQLSCRKRNY